MKQTINTRHVRAINQRTILDAIYQHPDGISRAELARSLNMSKPSMADNATALLDIGIIEEIGEDTNTGKLGRKPVLLSFRSDFKYIATIDFYLYDTYFSLSNLRGEKLNKFKIQQTPMTDFKLWIQMCANAISVLMNAQNISSDNLAAIAISLPGIINPEEKKYIVSLKYGEFDMAYLEDYFQTHFHVPVLIRNSTNAAALGEFYYGAGKNCKNLLYISCGQGVGSGLILNGKLYEGSHLASGEFGNFLVPPSLPGEKPRKLEDRISIEGVLSAINASLPDSVLQKLPDGETTVDFSSMIELWKAKDPYIRSFTHKTFSELGWAISCLQSVIDCEKIIIGGEYLAFAEEMLPTITQILHETSSLPVEVAVSDLWNTGGTLGLIATCQEYYFNKICSLEG